MAETHSVTFRGWPSDALESYDGLTVDNSKTYRTCHKAVYDTQVHAPKTRIVEFLRTSRPLRQWLDANVGPRRHDPRRHDPRRHDPRRHDPRRHDPRRHEEAGP